MRPNKKFDSKQIMSIKNAIKKVSAPGIVHSEIANQLNGLGLLNAQEQPWTNVNVSNFIALHMRRRSPTIARTVKKAETALPTDFGTETLAALVADKTIGPEKLKKMIALYISAE